MIHHVEIDDHKVEAAGEIMRAFGLLGTSSDNGVTISAGDRSVTIDAAGLSVILDLFRQLASAPVSNGEQGGELSPQEVATRLHMSRPTVMRLIAQGKLGARQVGAHYRLSEAEVMAYKVSQATIRRKSLDALSAFSQDFDQ